MTRGRRGRDAGWWSLIALMAVVTTSDVAACVWLVRRGDWGALVQAPGALLFAYWMAVGAWRRTSRGRVTVVAADVGPTLTDSHVRRMVLVAAACPVVLALALAIQVVVARS